MSTADELVKLIFSWIEQRESCALKLKELADELEIRESFLESDTLIDAKRIENRSDSIAANNQQLYEVLRRDVTRQNPNANFEHLDRLGVTEILKAVAKCNETIYDPTKWFPRDESLDLHSDKQFWLAAGLPVAVQGPVGITAWFVPQLWVEVERTVFGGAKTVLSGTVGLITALPLAIDNWKKLIEKDHVTEASKSIRGAAEEILKSCREWREKLDDIRNLQEISDKQQEAERQRVSLRRALMSGGYWR